MAKKNEIVPAEELDYDEDEFFGELPHSWKAHARPLKIRTTYGSEKELKSFVWNTLSACHQEDCPIFESCPDRKKESNSICYVERNYVNMVSSMVWRNFRNKLNEDEFFIVGMHILPMYRHLCRLKIWEWSVVDVMYENSKGQMLINPIYREIRETIKAISAQWKSIGVGKFQVIDPPNPYGRKGLPSGVPDHLEDPQDYYEAMASGKLGVES